MASLRLPCGACVATGLSPRAVWCLSGVTPQGQPWSPAVPCSPGHHGLSARWMAVLSPFRTPSLGRPVHHVLLRSAPVPGPSRRKLHTTCRRCRVPATAIVTRTHTRAGTDGDRVGVLGLRAAVRSLSHRADRLKVRETVSLWDGGPRAARWCCRSTSTGGTVAQCLLEESAGIIATLRSQALPEGHRHAEPRGVAVTAPP